MSLHVNTVLTMRLKRLQYNALCYPEDPKFFILVRYWKLFMRWKETKTETVPYIVAQLKLDWLFKTNSETYSRDIDSISTSVIHCLVAVVFNDIETDMCMYDVR